MLSIDRRSRWTILISVVLCIGVLIVLVHWFSSIPVESLIAGATECDSATVDFAGYKQRSSTVQYRLDNPSLHRVMGDLHIKGRLKRRWLPLMLSAIPVILVTCNTDEGGTPVIITITQDEFIICRVENKDYWAYLSDRQMVERLLSETESGEP